MLSADISDPTSSVLHLRGMVVTRMEAQVGGGDRYKQKGLMSSIATDALFCFHRSEKLSDASQKVILG